MHCTTKNIYDKPKSPRHQKVFREKLYAFNQINTRCRFNFTYLNCQCSIINTSATKLKQKPFIRLKKKRKKKICSNYFLMRHPLHRCEQGEKQFYT